MDYQKKIREQLSKGQIIPVVGAGVSYATAGTPGWKGLIENGLDYAISYKPSQESIDDVKVLLNENKLPEAAAILKEILGAPDHPFSNWINNIFERPVVKSTKLIESIQNLCQPIIATTNYDDLLRTVGSPQTDMALDWSQHEEIQSCLNNRKQFILHLHGIFTRPKTPIFGADDYENLKTQIGYKTILNKLWMDKHFLFIGCSRDGVMDEDFMTVLKLMQEWFPGLQKEHYILMPEKDLGTKNHLELLQKCNVHLVPFGKNYDELPNFINKLNPNTTEIVNRYQHHKDQVYEGIKSILEAQPGAEIDDNVKDFIKQNLGLPYYWLSNDKINIFMEALDNYNSSIKDKQRKFENLKILMKAVVNVSDLKSKIDSWPIDGNNISLLNNVEYINMGILAWELLNKFPYEILEDINLRDRTAIHPYYFTGSLKRFYMEAKRWKEDSGRLEDLNCDSYFFENLRRIMNSLLGVLELESNNIYAEKSIAKLASNLPQEFLLTVCPKRLSILNSDNLNNVIAELPWDENLEFDDAKIVNVNSNKIVVGYNSQYCFKWNPIGEITATNFFQVRPNEIILELEVLTQNENVVLEIYTSQRKIIMVNFSDQTEMSLKDRFRDHVKILSTGKIYCKTRLERQSTAPCIFELSALGEYVPKITSLSLWEMLKEIPEIFTEYSKYLKEENLNVGSEDFMYPYIEDISLSKVEWARKELIALKMRFGFSGANSTAIFFIDPTVGFHKPVCKIYFPHKNCFCYSTFSQDDQVDLIVGYLDFNDVGNLIQYFENIQSDEVIVAKNQPGLLPQEFLTRRQVRDMFYANFASKDRAFIIEEGKVLHDIDIAKLTGSQLEFEDGIKYISFYSK